MPDAKQFFATNNYRTDDSGYSAFETLGRRVGGQYDQAGNDLRDIGRAKAATINMLGRWPFNILELEKRESLRYAKMNAPAAGGSGSRSPGGVVSRPTTSNITDDQFAPRRMPNLAALNEMAEGAGRFGSMVGGSQLPYLAQQRGVREAQQQREQERQNRAQDAANQKRWDLYEKNLKEDRDALDKSTREYFDQNPSFSQDLGTQRMQRDMVLGGDATLTDFGIGGVWPDPAPVQKQGFGDWLLYGPASQQTNYSGGSPSSASTALYSSEEQW